MCEIWAKNRIGITKEYPKKCWFSLVFFALVIHYFKFECNNRIVNLLQFVLKIFLQRLFIIIVKIKFKN